MLWNVSWDITFLRFINDNSIHVLSGLDAKIKGNCIFVTKDKALAETAGFLNIVVSQFGKKMIPTMNIDKKNKV